MNITGLYRVHVSGKVPVSPSAFQFNSEITYCGPGLNYVTESLSARIFPAPTNSVQQYVLHFTCMRDFKTYFAVYIDLISLKG